MTEDGKCSCGDGEKRRRNVGTVTERIGNVAQGRDGDKEKCWDSERSCGDAEDRGNAGKATGRMEVERRAGEGEKEEYWDKEEVGCI